MSLGSILVLIAAAQTFGPGELGNFSIAIATCLLLQSLSRALLGEVLIAQVSRGEDYREQFWSAGLSIALVAGAVASCSFEVLVNDILAAFACGFFTMMSIVQDCCRAERIFNASYGRLFVYTLVANAGQALSVFLLTRIYESLAVSILALAIPLMLTIPIVGWVYPSRNLWTNGKSWFRSFGRPGAAYIVEVLSGALVGYSLVVYLTLLVDATAIAAFRATVAVFGLTSVLINFSRASVLRIFKDRIDIAPEFAWMGAYFSLVVFFTLGVGSAYIVLLILPDKVGASLVGQTWSLVVPLLLLGAIDRFMASLATIPTVLLRAAGITWAATRFRLTVCAIGLIAAPIFIHQFGSSGAFAAEILVYLLLLIGLSYMLVEHSKRRSKLQ